MKILSWNVKGYNAPDKKHPIKRRVCQVKPKIIMLEETKFKGNDISNFRQSWSRWDIVFMEVEGAFGGLGIKWKS